MKSLNNKSKRSLPTLVSPRPRSPILMCLRLTPIRRRVGRLLEHSVVFLVKLSLSYPSWRRTSTERRPVVLTDPVDLDVLALLKTERAMLRSLKMPSQTNLESPKVVSLEPAKKLSQRHLRMLRKVRRITQLNQLTLRKDGSPGPTFKISCSHTLVKSSEVPICHLWLATVI